MDYFKEYEQLKKSVPRCALFNISSQNSDFCAYSRSNKNCYLCRGNDYNENFLYGYWVYHNEDCVDSSYIYDSQLLYECVDCKKCYNLNFCQDCQNSSDSWFLYNCYGCVNCYMCANLKHAEFYILNKKYSREDYLGEIELLKKIPIDQQQNRFNEFLLQHPRLYMHQTQNENSIGDYVYNTRNCYACYDLQDAEDSMYLSHALKMKDCTDCDFMYNAELCYECESVEGHNCNFCYVCWECSNMEFCELCFNCQDCFFCIGLKSHKYHIFNKPYSKEEYFKKVAEIKEELRAQGQYNGRLPEIFYEG